MPQQRKLKMLRINDLRHLARLLGTSPIALVAMFKAVHANEDAWYRTRFEPKKSGNGMREINPPLKSLKLMQKRINRLLQRLLVPVAVKGGIKGHSHLDHAAVHTGKTVVITMDLSDFYPSVKSGRVYDIFCQRLGCSPDIARLLTRLTTYHGRLPQGAPTSGIIAVLAAERLAMRLMNLAEAYHAIFTMYMDDMAFSAYYLLPKSFQAKVKEIVEQERFKLKEAKTEEMVATKREQLVTGLKVNDGLDIPSETMARLRDDIAVLGKEKDEKLVRSVAGKLNFWTQPALRSRKVTRLQSRYRRVIAKANAGE